MLHRFEYYAITWKPGKRIDAMVRPLTSNTMIFWVAGLMASVISTIWSISHSILIFISWIVDGQPKAYEMKPMKYRKPPGRDIMQQASLRDLDQQVATTSFLGMGTIEEVK